ncbi:glycosyltransferase family 2 protein [Pseudomonas syringae]|uniref:glycosyltransferase family 2 protein n=1 Tax=Pseudomonas viridiflava TaxID=33069 RepID=UPI000F04155D|nr:glycosyltransferase family 2 protein [Pseudomonas viridiflava]
MRLGQTINKDLTAGDRSFSRASDDSGRIAILLCTYNGTRFLKEQLDSFERQSFTNWILYVSDDASVDGTREILSEYQKRLGQERVIIVDGPCMGFAENFMSLIRRPEVSGDYFAFSDQDDIWLPDKLQKSVAALRSSDGSLPELYCSRTALINERGDIIGATPLMSKPPTFQNALVESIAGANTMLINGAVRDLLLLVPAQCSLVTHDWLIYMLVTGCGGKVVYDGAPSLYYRQHGDNLIGASSGFLDRLRRLPKTLSGQFVGWNDMNSAILEHFIHLFTHENRETFFLFSLRKEGLLTRLSALYKSGVHRQTLKGNIALLIAAVVGRV